MHATRATLSSVSTEPMIPALPAVATLPATATLPDVATLPATATLPAVATLPATAILPPVATLPATARLPSVDALPAPARPPDGSTSAGSSPLLCFVMCPPGRCWPTAWRTDRGGAIPPSRGPARPQGPGQRPGAGGGGRAPGP